MLALTFPGAIEHLFAGTRAQQGLLRLLRLAVAALLPEAQHLTQGRVHVLRQEGARVHQRLHDFADHVIERLGHGVPLVVPAGKRRKRGGKEAGDAQEGEEGGETFFRTTGKTGIGPIENVDRATDQ